MIPPEPQKRSNLLLLVAAVLLCGVLLFSAASSFPQQNILLVVLVLAMTMLMIALMHIMRARIRWQQLQLKAASADGVSKRQFLANMSHELRTPLHIILGYSEMMLEDENYGQDARLQRDLLKIRDAANHLSSLVNEVLEFSKLESGGISLDEKRCNIEPLLDEVSIMAQQYCQKHNNHFKVLINAIPAQLYTDPVRLQQVLLYLLDNAAKFTHDGEVCLHVSTRQSYPQDELLLEVTDNGPGIAPEKLERLFEAFACADDSATRTHEGMGLGLGMARKLIARLGGELQLQSQPGQGTRCMISLPIRTEPSVTSIEKSDYVSPYQQRAQHCAAQTNRRRRVSRILVIDHDEHSGDLLQRYLRQHGFEVFYEHHAQQALDRVDKCQPDMILLDKDMPGLDGWRILRQLKGSAHHHIPVIMVSIDSEFMLARELGASGSVNKPLNWPALLNQICSILRQQAA